MRSPTYCAVRICCLDATAGGPVRALIRLGIADRVPEFGHLLPVMGEGNKLSKVIPNRICCTTATAVLPRVC